MFARLECGGDVIVACSNNTVLVWALQLELELGSSIGTSLETSRARTLCQWTGPSPVLLLCSSAILPGVVAAVVGRKIALLHVTANQLIPSRFVNTGHKTRITSLSFHPAGERLASSALDPLPKLWSVHIHREREWMLVESTSTRSSSKTRPTIQIQSVYALAWIKGLALVCPSGPPVSV